MVDIEDIRGHARALLDKGQVRGVLGFRRGTVAPMAEPVLITDTGAIDSLIWDPTCVHNLALYLVKEKKKRLDDRRPLAVIAKGCDSRAIVVLLQENNIARKDVEIIGVSCEGTGVVDPRKLARAFQGKPILATAFDGEDRFQVETRDGLTSVDANEVLADRCLECREAFPRAADAVFGEKVEGRQLAPRFQAVDKILALSEEKRAEFWAHHFERCLRCFACRSVCPMCYCHECVVDSITQQITHETTAEEKADRIKWIERSATRSENAMYHLTRAIHLAGRCIDCGECERVCPVNIPVRLLNNQLEKDALEMFEYVPGVDPEQSSLMSSFRDEDPNAFVR